VKDKGRWRRHRRGEKNRGREKKRIREGMDVKASEEEGRDRIRVSMRGRRG
jgi:hypothetical protein